MLRPEDLLLFLRAFDEAVRGNGGLARLAPADSLRRDTGLFAGDILRLSRSLDIAAEIGRCPAEAAAAADIIGRTSNEFRYAPLDEREAWQAAIAWAIEQPGYAEKRSPGLRQMQVAAACRRLEGRGHRIEIQSHGPNVTERIRLEVARSIESLVILMGGQDVIAQVLGGMSENRLHDGMWLFGDFVPPIYQTKRPTLPFGWLVSLGLKHIGRRGNARKPDVAWGTIVELATDLAAAIDCERYNQFEGIGLDSSDFVSAAGDSLGWRELFSLPQAPAVLLSPMRKAAELVLTADDERVLGFTPAAYFDEVEGVLRRCVNDRPTQFPAAVIRRDFPLLAKHAFGARGAVNRDYLDPLGASERNHERLVFFERHDGTVISLPRSFIVNAACECLFRLFWARLDKNRAKDVVGENVEHTIAEACAGKTAKCLRRARYEAHGERYDLDTATRDGNDVVFFETKAKSLTAQARGGDFASFLTDYSDSYLTLLKQLARHELHLRQGLTPLNDVGDERVQLRPIKVAVSPLSYGPVSDKFLGSGLFIAMVNARLRSDGTHPAVEHALKKYNTAIENVLKLLVDVAPKKGENLDLFDYFIDVFWLDLGQLVYALSRSSTVSGALTALRHFTFVTRDYWTEVAIADRQGLLKSKWKSIG